MLVVFAVGIRQGQAAFVAALSVVGCGELAQVVRGHVLTIRQRLYILDARATGLSGPQILSRHVLPGLLPAVIALSALGMAGALLLRELGFVHVFIGGGGNYIDGAVGVIRSFDTPDWGAMLGTARRYFRVKPWLSLAPALAFFVVILGFNLFGYGLRRFIEKGRFHPSGWSLVRTLAAIGLVLLGMRGILAGSSEEAQYEKLARQFDVQRAWDDIAQLNWPDENGQGAQTGEGLWVASYIAHEFPEVGLTELPTDGYLQAYVGIEGRVTAWPVLEVLAANGEASLVLDEDISFDPEDAFLGTAGTEAEVWVLANARPGTVTDIPPSEALLLLIEPSEEIPGSWVRELPFAGVLRVVSEEELARNDIAPTFTGVFRPLAIGPLFTPPSVARLVFGEAAADRLLHRAGLELEALRAAVAKGERIVVPMGLRVHLRAGLEYAEVPALYIIGYLPGADVTSAGERILVVAPYGVPSPDGGTSHIWADDNGGGVAVMLETARLWKDIGFDPKRTVVFAAIDVDGGSYFMNHPPLPVRSSDTWTVVLISGLWAGEPRLARTDFGSGLARALDQSARRLGVRTRGLENWEVFFRQASSRTGYMGPDTSYSGVAVTRLGDGFSGTSGDTLDHLDPQLLLEAGHTLAHYLTVLSSR